jgi:hypothetical protein
METSNRNLDVNQKAQELVNLIKTRFITTDGLLARNYPVTNRTLFTDFDDIVPFFIFFEETEFLLSQVRITRTIDEWFGGLYTLWKETADQTTYNLLKESVEFVFDYLIIDGFFSAAFYEKNNHSVPYYEPWSSGILETFCEMRDEFPFAFEQSQKVLRAWIQDEYFKMYSLFPYRVYLSPAKKLIQKKILSSFFPIRRNSRPPTFACSGRNRWVKHMLKRIHFYAINGLYSQLMKSNSTCAFSLLEFYKATGDKFWFENLLKWATGAIEGFCNQGKVYMEFVPKTGARRDAGITPTFILADVLCDTVYFAENCIPEYKNRFMSTIKEILDYGWQSRLENGLVPRYDGGDFAHIDNQVDFAVSLRRYSELSGDQIYKAKSVDLTKRVLELYYSPDGYFTYAGNKPNNAIDPKYNALLLKGFANLLTINEPLYPHYHSLFKDR